MKLYKLTDENDQTFEGCQWGEGVEHTADGKGELCTEHWLHAYTNPVVAVFMNAIHSNFTSPTLWEADGDIGKTDGDLKCGCTRLKTVKRITLPVLTTEQRVEIAIRCVKQVCKNKKWNTWADNWLNGTDRSLKAARWAEAAAAREEMEAAKAARSARWAAAAAEEAATWARSAVEAAKEDGANKKGKIDLLSVIATMFADNV